MENETNRIQRIEQFLLDPERTLFETIEEFEEAVSILLPFLQAIDFEKLETIQGEDGVTPVRGVDYFTDEDLDLFESFILERMPVADVDYPTVSRVTEFIKAEVAKIPRVKGKDGKSLKFEDLTDEQKKELRGRDGSRDTGADILRKLRDLGKNQGLKIKDIRGLPNKIRLLNELAEKQVVLEEDIKNINLTWPTATQGDPGEPGEDGNFINTYKGEWTAGAYQEGDIVVHDGSSYIAVTNTSGEPGDSADWQVIASHGPQGEPGDDGRNIELQTSATHIQWRYVGDTTWTNLVPLADLKGDKGDDGEEVELRTNATHIQWRLGTGAWQNLIALADLKGDPGNPGADGTFLDTFQGAWSAGTYEEGDIVTHNGSTYIATTNTSATPGASADWSLLAEKGADGTGAGDMLASVYDPAGGKKQVAFESDVDGALEGKVDKVVGKGLSDENYTTTEKNKLGGIETGAQVNTVTSVAGKTGAVTLAKADVGLGNVDNTSDLAKPISTATQNALDAKQATITGGATTIVSSNLTTNRALISNGSGKVAVSAVTATQLGYLSGVTSNVQTQLDGKADAKTRTTTASAASLTPNLTTAEYQEYTALAAAFTLNAPTGGVAGDNFHLVVTATGANRNITFNASYQFLENNDAPTEIETGFTYDFVISKTNSSYIISWGRVEN